MSEDVEQKMSEKATSAAEPAAQRASALQRLIEILLPLSADDRQNVLETVQTFFGTHGIHNTAAPIKGGHSTSTRPTNFQFSEELKKPSPKAFMFEKSPQTDVERVACLAYYLAHYRDVPHVKTKDITSLNTESAHKPFSNTAVSVENATKMGYLVPSVKGAKQISALGERFVEALPDRDAAREIFERSRKRRVEARQKKPSEG
jgi:hypothetical protein